MTGTAAQVDQTTLGEQNNVTAGSHGESVDLGLDVDGLGGVGLEPGNVNLDVKVADAGWSVVCGMKVGRGRRESEGFRAQ